MAYPEINTDDLLINLRTILKNDSISTKKRYDITLDNILVQTLGTTKYLTDSINTDLEFTANATINAYDVVTATGLVGDSTDISQKGKIIGINKTDITSGFVGNAKSNGSITNSSWSWTIGDKIYLNGTSLSTTAPSIGFSQYIGVATASDTIDINLGIPVLL